MKKIHFHINYEYPKVVCSLCVCLCAHIFTIIGICFFINLERSYYKVVSCVVFVPNDLRLYRLFHNFQEISVMLQGRFYAIGRSISHSTISLKKGQYTPYLKTNVIIGGPQTQYKTFLAT